MAKIIGNTTATPNPRPDWSQTDTTKADYIKNKPNIPTKTSELSNDSNFVTLSDVPAEIYVGNGDMPEDATIQILTDGSDEKQMRVKQADGSIVSIPLGSGASDGGGYYIPSVTDNGNNTITISFTPSSDDMPAVDSVTFNAGDTQTLEEMLQGFSRDPGSVKAYVDSVAGEAGGYYTPSVVDNKDGTISIAFTPSESGMTQIAPFRLALPKGDKGDTGATPIFETDEIITLEPGESAYVVIHNDDPENPIMDFGIPRGADGKSAYEYAQDGGYTGSEAEFTTKLAEQSVSSQINEHNTDITSHPDIREALNNKAPKTHEHAAADITSGVIIPARLPTASADGKTPGITIVYPAASCTTFSSDSGTVTPLAVQKGAKQFAITRPTGTTENTIARYSNTTGDVKTSKILIEDVTNTKDSSKKANVLSIPAEGNKKMVYGYCTDQVDGTSFIGGVFPADATEFPYSAGLAIGGTSGNLLWKGARVATADDLNGKLSTTGTAAKATADASGNVITNTYETKADATAKLNEVNAQISQLSSEKASLTERVDGLEADVVNIQAGTLQQAPLFANSSEELNESGDTSKLYVLPDGNIWAYTYGLVENKVNQYKPNTAKFNYRLHHAYIGTANDPWRTGKGFMYVEIDGIDLTNKTSYIIRISGVEIIRHSFGASGGVSFFNQPASTAFDFTGHTSSTYFDFSGSVLIHRDGDGYYFDLMEANPAADTVRCIFGITLADNEAISTATCENLFIEAVPLTTYKKEYSWRDTGIPYTKYELTDYDTNVIAEKVGKKIEAVVYVDGEAGNNDNTGSQNSPLKTIQKAIDSGAKTIYCKAGIYNEGITLKDAHGVKIIGEWEAYESGKRPKVRIDHSTVLTPDTAENGLKTINLPSDSYKYQHPLLYNVFVTKQYSPTMGSGVNIAYVVSMWNVTDDRVSEHYKLVPVMTLEECQSTDETFFYDGTTLYIHSTGSTFKMVSNTKSNTVDNCSDIVFEDIAFDYSYNDTLAVNNSNGIIFRNCEFSHSSKLNGLATVNVNGELYNCEAYRNRNDGLNFHGFGETTVYNCIGAYNYDDGISHHDGCTGSIHGGQYHHNGKGGVSSPTYGAVIDIYNVVMNNNQYGIYAYGGTADRQIIVNGCYIHHNTYGIGSSYELLVIHSTITDNSTNTGGNVTVI